MKCQNCQTENPEDARFCYNCGTTLALVCSNCKTALPAGAKFCFNCGQATPVTQEAPPSAPPPAPDDQKEEWLHRYIPQNLLNKLEAARSSGLMEGERRIVTILFCDVKGSTAAASRLDPEEWSEIMNGAFEPMIAPVYRYEGTVARLTGDGLLAFFGAPIAHEDDPQRAILAGLEIIEAINAYGREIKRKWGLEFDVRVGINTGLVVVGAVGSDLRMEYSAMGNAINLAARMEQTAALGSVQIAEPTYKLVAPLFDFEDLGGLMVKGIDEPVQSYRVLGVKADPGRLRGLAGLQAPLVGRDQQIAALRLAVEALRQGSGRIVSVIGEAGLGKSRLVSELKQELYGSNVLWLEGRSQSFETGTPYAPFVEVLADYFELDAGQAEVQQLQQIKDSVDLLMPGQGDAIAPFFASMLDLPLEPMDAERVKYLQPPVLRGAIFAQARSLFEQHLSRQPLVLYLDDLHWIDPTSLQMLHFLLPLVQQHPLLIIAAFRPRRDEPSWNFHELAQGEYDDNYEAIFLNPLDQQHSRELVANLLTVDDLPEQVRQTILDKSEGNPFFVEETIRTLLDNGLVVRENGRWRATTEIRDIAFPDTLVGVITARLDRLDENTRQIAQAAAVLGREFAAGVLGDIVEAPSNLDEALDVLQRRELINETSRLPEPIFNFKHILTQQAAYDSVLLSNRRELHRRAAESFQVRRPDHTADIARHWLAARQPSKALPFLVEAGDRAARAYATAEAIDFYQQALSLGEAVQEPDLLRRTYEGLGDALVFANRAPEAMDVFQELLAFGEAHGDAASEISALNKMASTSAMRMGQFPAADGYLQRSEVLIEQHSETNGAAEAALIRCMMCTAQADFESVVLHMGQLAEIGEQVGSKEYSALGLEHVASSLMWLTRFDEAQETAVAALQLAREIGDREHEAMLLTITLPLVAIRNGDMDGAKAYLEQGIQVAQRINALAPAVIGEWVLMEIANWQGDFEEALARGNSALEQALPTEEMMPWLVVMILGTLGSTYLAISKQFSEQIAEFHHHALRLLESPAGTMTGATTWADLGYCAMELDDYAIATDVFQKGLNQPTMFMRVELPRLLAGSALLALENGDLEEALALAEEAVAFAQEKEMRNMFPVTYMALGKILTAQERYEEALAALEEAQTSASALGMRPDVSKALRATADVLQAHGQAEAAAAKRESAAEVIESIAADFTDETLRNAYLDANLILASAS